jgi:hypothetical protein
MTGIAFEWIGATTALASVSRTLADAQPTESVDAAEEP